MEAEPGVDCVERGYQEKPEGGEFDHGKTEVCCVEGMGEQRELYPKDSQTEPAAPTVDVLEGIVRGEAESWVCCDAQGEEDDEKDVGGCDEGQVGVGLGEGDGLDDGEYCKPED